MKKRLSITTKRIAISLCSLLIASSIFAQSNLSNSNWQDIEENTISLSNSTRHIIPNIYRTVSFNIPNLKVALANTHLSPQGKSKTVISLPNPDGTSARYLVYSNTTMHPTLQSTFPSIRTYNAVSIDNPGEIAKIDITPLGFHAMILTSNGGQFFIDPYALGNTYAYQVYDKKDYNGVSRLNCDVNSTTSILDELNEGSSIESFGSCELRTYRLALACTQEYANAVGGGTVAGALAAQVTTMNRVNGIYERDMAITMEIIANNNLLINTSEPDGYTDNNAGALIGEVQTTIDGTIGSGNYDIGHVFSTGGGGLAGLGVVCNNGQKARGVTGSANPQGDAYDIDYVAHEMGHQFDCNHTQNNNCNRNNATAMEPGSASSIMGYAGICAPNVQNNSDALFHGISLQEMGAFVTSGGHTCPVKTTLTNNAPSVVGSPGNITIPQGTPFALTMVASDPDPDPLTYTWEQMDNQTSTQSPVSTSTNGPNFRSILPSTDPTRYFPNLTDLSNGGPFTWEVLPTVTRTMNFRGVVRDNSPGGGCNDHVDITVTTDGGSGPFIVTYPSATGITWNGATSETVTWNEAGSASAPVSCANVDIFLSIDGGTTYPTQLASSVANNGSFTITVPNTPSTTCRIMVMCDNGTFFDISDNDFEIAAATFDYTLAATPTTINVCPPANGTTTIDVGSIGGYNDPVTLSVSGVPAGANSAFSVNPVTPVGSSVLTISNTGAATPGTYPLVIQGVSTSGTKTINVTLIIADPAPAQAVLTTPVNSATGVATPTSFAWNLVPGAGVIYDIDIATDAGFSTIVDNAVGLATNSYNSAALAINTLHYWRVRAYTACGSAAFSTTFSFTTANTSCATTMSTNIPVAISASGTPTITSTITIPTNGTIMDVNVVSLTGQHTWINDLTVTLTSPLGTNVILWSNICNNENDFDLNFDDAATPGALPCPPVGGGTYQPTGSLASLNGEASNGIWTLTITDGVNQDGGSLDTWGLEICTTPLCNEPDVPTLSTAPTICIGNSSTLNVTGGNLNDATDWEWYTASCGGTSVGNGTSLVVSPSVTTTYFVRGEGGCSTPGTCASVTVTVNTLTTPTFTQVGPICTGDPLSPLPTTSNNSITGTWSPALNNTTTTLYTFSPAPGQCASTATMTITVNVTPITPTFTQVADICNGNVLSPLPTTSNNSVTGTWSPALDNTTTTLYTFTPTAGQCANTATMTITVNQLTTPTFTQVAAICNGNTLSPLPTTSNNSITGTWSPALDNTTTTLYTFTPTAGQCANTTTMTITVNQLTTPTFTQVADICNGDALTALPTTSNNSITGSWSPALDNTTTTLYTFTPNPGQCASTATMTITVNDNPVAGATYSPSTAICPGTTVQFDASSSTGAVGYSWSFTQGTPSIASSILVNPALSFGASGTHDFTMIATNNCGTDTYNGQIIIDVCTGIDDINSGADFSSYYDNINHQIELSMLNLDKGDYDFAIVNALGQQLMNKKISVSTNDEKQSIPFTTKATGIYYIYIYNGETKYDAKFFK